MRTRLPALVLTAAVALSLSACGGSDDPATPSAGKDGAAEDGAAVVRAASLSSTKDGSSRFSLVSSTTIQGSPLQITGDGVFDYAGKEGTLTLKLPTGTVEERVVDGAVYLALSQQPGSFYRLDLAALQGTSLGASTDPGASFSSLQAVREGVTVVGKEQVRDAATTHYRGSLDVKKALAATGAAGQVARATLGRAGADTLPFDAWVDGDGRLRRYVQVLDVPASPKTGGQPVKSTTTLELYDYGTDVSVTAPPASSVKDGAPLLAALKGAGR